MARGSTKLGKVASGSATQGRFMERVKRAAAEYREREEYSFVGGQRESKKELFVFTDKKHTQCICMSNFKQLFQAICERFFTYFLPSCLAIYETKFQSSQHGIFFGLACLLYYSKQEFFLLSKLLLVW